MKLKNTYMEIILHNHGAAKVIYICNANFKQTYSLAIRSYKKYIIQWKTQSIELSLVGSMVIILNSVIGVSILLLLMFCGLVMPYDDMSLDQLWLR